MIKIKRKKKNKKTKKKIITTILVLILIMGIHYKVQAGTKDSELKKEFSGYYVSYSQSNSPLKTTNKNIYTINGIHVYCIELGIDISTSIYNSTTDFSITGLSQEQIDYIKLISYYGYDYKEHKNDIKYYLAAQELIWRYLSECDLYWTESLNYPLIYIDIESYKNEILQLIKRHNTKPIIDTNINSYVGESITLKDKNQVLSEYYIETSGNQEAYIEDNKITIKINPNYIGKDVVKLTRKQEYERDNLLYYYNESQKLIDGGILKKDTIEINLNIKGATLDIYKYDRDNNSNISSGEASLSNAKYELYNTNNELIRTFITDEQGHSYLDNLSLGTYYVKEITPSNGYLLNEEITEISLNSHTNKIIIYEDVIKSKIELLKLYGNKNDNVLKPEPNIIFNIYNKENILYRSIITDENGYCEIYLPYGEYTISQSSTTKGYEKIEDIHIIIDENSNKMIRYNLFDKEINPYLKIIKLDSESNLPILQEGIKFKVKNLSTNKYITYFDKYTNQTIDTFETNNNGIAIIPVEINYGEYQIEELNPPKNYKSSTINFKLTKDSEIYYNDNYGYMLDINITNIPIKSTIKINKTGNKFIINNNSFYYDNIPLENIKFNIYANKDIITLDGIVHYYKDEIINTFSTDKEGNILIENLYQGDYCIEEIETQENYILNLEPYCFNLTEQEKIINLVNNLKTGNILIFKIDSETNLPLKGAIVELYTINDELIQTSMSNENGKIEINNLQLGSYYVKEKKAPNNYNLDNTKYYFNIEENNQTVTLNITNKKIKQSEIINTGITIPKTKIIIITILILLLTSLIIYLKSKK